MKKLKVGKILTTHGLKGELKIKSQSDYGDVRFQKGNHLYLNYNSEELEMTIATSRIHKNNYLVSFEGHQDINAVEKYKGLDVFATKDVELLDEDEIYYDDLIGCNVVDNTTKKIGVVVNVMETMAHDILVLKTLTNKKAMVPYVDAFIEEVDIESKLIVIKNMAGLIDED